MSASETISIGLEMRIDQLREQLEKVPGIADKEARAMVKAVEKQYKAVERQAKKTANAQKKQFGKTADAAKDTAERVASLFGGAFADVSDSVLDLGGRFGELAGTIGGVGGAAVGVVGGVGALALALGFAGAAGAEFMSTARENVRLLEQWEGLEPVGPADIAAIEAYGHATDTLEGAALRAKVELQTGLAPAATTVANAMIGAISVMNEFGGSIEDSLNMARVPIAMGTIGLSELALYGVRLLAEEGEAASESIHKLTDEQIALAKAAREGSDAIVQQSSDIDEMAAALGYVTLHVVDLDEKKRKADAWAKKQAAEEKQRLDEAEALWARAGAQWARIQAKQAADAQKAASAAEKSWTDAYAAMTSGWEGVSTAGDEYNDAAAQKTSDAAMMAAEGIYDTGMQLATTLADVQIQALQREAQARQDVHRKALEQLETEREGIRAKVESGRMSAAAGKEEIRRINDEEKAARRANRQQARAQRKALKRSFKARQALARTQAVIDAAANAVALTGALAYLGPAAPTTATAIAGGQLSTQLAIIKSQEAPKFALGGMVRDRATTDHVMVRAEPDEGILTRRGVRSAGGPQGVDALNRGLAGGAGRGPVMLALDGRILGEIVARTVRSDTRVTTALDARTGALPGVRR